MNKEVTLYLRTGYELIKKGISDNALATYIALRFLYNQYETERVIDVETINYILTNEFSMAHDNKKFNTIGESIEELDELKVVEILQCDKKRFLLDMSNLYQSTEINVNRESIDPFTGEITGTENEKVNNYFVKFDLADIQKTLKDNGNNKSIFRYMFYMLNLKSENKDMYFFTKEREELSYITGFSTRTIDKYNNILMDNHILYVYKYDYKYVSNDRTVNNVYGLYQDKAIIDKECNSFIKEKLDNGEVRKSKSYANKGKNTKAFKESLKAVKEETEETPKRAFEKRLSVEIEPTDEELMEIEKKPVKIDIAPPIEHKPTYKRASYEQMKAWGFDDKSLREMNIFPEVTPYQDFDESVPF